MRSGQSLRPARRPENWQSVCSVSDASAVRPRFICSARLSASLKLAALAAIAVAISGCAQQQTRRYSGATGGKEYFAEGKYGKASPRVVLMGEDVPKGGGRYLVGRPYRIAGRTYVPSEKQAGYTVTGTASWYGAAFHGRRTANGEIYDMASITAAHPTMPLPSYARVTNLKNGKSIVVRVNDRGPYHGGRVMDMSSRVADLLDFKGAGTARVKVDYIGKAGLGGSDDRQLAATLSIGAPAQLAGYETPVSAPAVATADPAQEPPLAPEPAPRRQPMRRAPPPPPLETRAPAEEAPLAAEAPATATAYAGPALQPRHIPTRSSKPVVLDGANEGANETEETAAEGAAAAPAPATSSRAQAAHSTASAPVVADAPTPPRRPAAFAAAEVDEDAPAPPRRRTRAEEATALYFSPDDRLATRLAAPAQPFSRLRDIAPGSGR